MNPKPVTLSVTQMETSFPLGPLNPAFSHFLHIIFVQFRLENFYVFGLFLG